MIAIHECHLGVVIHGFHLGVVIPKFYLGVILRKFHVGFVMPKFHLGIVIHKFHLGVVINKFHLGQLCVNFTWVYRVVIHKFPVGVVIHKFHLGGVNLLPYLQICILVVEWNEPFFEMEEHAHAFYSVHVDFLSNLVTNIFGKYSCYKFLHTMKVANVLLFAHCSELLCCRIMLGFWRCWTRSV